MTDRRNYNTQSNFYKKRLITTKKEYFNNLDTKKVTHNKTLLRAVVPTFSDKNSKSDKIILNKEGKTVSDEKELCRTFSTYFANIVSDLQIPKIQEVASNIGVIMTLCQQLLTRFKITRAFLILNKDNLTRFLVLKTQMKIKSVKLLKA